MAHLPHPQLRDLFCVIDHQHNAGAPASLPDGDTRLGSPASVDETAAQLVEAGLLRHVSGQRRVFEVSDAGLAAAAADHAHHARRRASCRDELLAWVVTTTDFNDGKPVSRTAFAGEHEGDEYSDREIAMATLFLDDSGFIGSLDAPGEPNIVIWPTSAGRDCLAQGGIAQHLALTEGLARRP